MGPKNGSSQYRGIGLMRLRRATSMLQVWRAYCSICLAYYDAGGSSQRKKAPRMAKAQCPTFTMSATVNGVRQGDERYKPADSQGRSLSLYQLVSRCFARQVTVTSVTCHEASTMKQLLSLTTVSGLERKGSSRQDRLRFRFTWEQPEMCYVVSIK